MIYPGVYISILKEKESELGFWDHGLGLPQELPTIATSQGTVSFFGVSGLLFFSAQSALRKGSSM